MSDIVLQEQNQDDTKLNILNKIKLSLWKIIYILKKLEE